MPRRTDEIKVLLHLLNIILFLLTTVGTTGSTVSGTEKDIMHAIAGNPFMIRTWPMISSILSITVKMKNNTILDMSICEGNDNNSTVQNSRMMIIYNKTIQEVYLWFENISKEDGGMYTIKENFYRTDNISDENEAVTYDRKYGTCYLEIYVPVHPVHGSQREIVDTIVGEQCIIGTWPLNGSNLAINVTKDKVARLTAVIDGSIGKHTTVQIGRLLLKYNHIIMAASLMFTKVSREDEGLYEIEESVFTTESVPYDKCTYGCKAEYDRWILELNVLETGEVTHGETGKSMTMEFEIVSGTSTLCNYVTVSEIMDDKGCSVSTQSHLYGRLKCTRDTFHNIFRIIINNVTQRDAGLYTVSTGRDTRMRRYLNITEKHTCAVVGEIMTMGWFYNQQGIQRILLVVHNNMDVIMQLAPTNVPEIKSKFKHRLSYKGDVSRSLMLLSLLNVTTSDAGLYTLETLHGNTIPGYTQLNVEAVCPNTSSTPINLPLSIPLNPYSASRPKYESSTDVLSTGQEPIFTQLIVAVVSGSVSVIILMSIAVIYLQRKNSYWLDTAVPTPLAVGHWNEEELDQSVAQSGLTRNVILGLHHATIKNLTQVDPEGRNNYPLKEIEDNTLNDNANYMSSASCDYDTADNILVVSPSASALQKTIRADENEVNVSREVANSIQDVFATVNKRSLLSSSNTDKLNPRHEFSNETEENNGFETFKTVLSQMSTTNAKVYDDADGAAIEISNMEPNEDMILPGKSCEDYADTLV